MFSSHLTKEGNESKQENYSYFHFWQALKHDNVA